ncbi:putative AP superfamily protein [Terriglobus roseus DSM 18391]|uniref:Putative AP superfamily protein n=1 Tax=Terriglobus roseus (strain DSM 18391 / NRRL B-41598 / KBS 63) TaxID=926566 RepID=I3ZK65_TERRK|nr:alkaline phosphatase family protein [Terriglobus roseus]AFL89633.1 putative AP superfamily protein [Terriglobus roseus DSM 18391]
MLLRRLAAAAVSAALCLSTAAPARAAAYDGSPKLVIELVFDQFRGDYLDRFRADFKAKNGWNLFLKQGAHYTDCYYDYANLVTGPGHSTIGTGAYTDGHGVPVNDWYEKGPDGKLRYVQSIDDDRYTIVGQPAGAKVSPGASPHYEVASTLGDELVLATSGKARVFGVSLKDRAAILTSGHATKGAFWTDHESGRWITSTYWQKQLPAWVEAFNSGDAVAKARAASKIPEGSFYEKVGATQAGVAYQLDFAKALIQNEHLGHNEAGVTDLITISVSSTDIMGHRVGPDDPQQRALIDASDIELDRFFTWIDSTIGLKNVVVSMTGDHGVAPSVNAAVAMGMPAHGVPTRPMWDYVEKALQAKFKPKGNVKYVLGGESPWLQIDPEPFQAQGISEQQAEDATADAVRDYFASLPASTTAQTGAPAGRLPEPLRVQFVYTASQLRNGQVPDTDQGRRELHSYSPAIRWAVHMNFGAYQYYGSEMGTTHYSANSYDRHVPLDFFGAAFQPGTYHNQVEPVDIAATFASLLRVNRPSAAVGHVRLEALKPEVTSMTGTVKRK